jgi:arsenate reductase (thioredoxin)
MGINPQVQELISKTAELSKDLTESRTSILNQLGEKLNKEINAKNVVNLAFICTHNSRRSHISQLLAHLFINDFKISNIASYSAGTEATAFNERAVNAFKSFGFEINITQQGENPLYEVSFGDNIPTALAFSKTFQDDSISKENLFAVMTCSHAEENCPLIPGTTYRVALPYEDPKAFDDTPEEEKAYREKVLEIGAELYWLFSRL